jgi:hypothetical protein
MRLYASYYEVYTNHNSVKGAWFGRSFARWLLRCANWAAMLSRRDSIEWPLTAQPRRPDASL